MTFPEYLKMFAAAIGGTLFFAILFRAPKRALPTASLLGGAIYLMYLIVSRAIGQELPGYFAATFLATLAGEVAARKLKMPATTFIVTAVIVMVPGLGLYRTMLYLVQGRYELAGEVGISTVLSIGAMALAIALGTLLFRAGLSVVSTRKSSQNR